jgi:hypothetical protein
LRRKNTVNIIRFLKRERIATNVLCAASLAGDAAFAYAVLRDFAVPEATAGMWNDLVLLGMSLLLTAVCTIGAAVLGGLSAIVESLPNMRKEPRP